MTFQGVTIDQKSTILEQNPLTTKTFMTETTMMYYEPNNELKSAGRTQIKIENFIVQYASGKEFSREFIGEPFSLLFNPKELRTHLDDEVDREVINLHTEMATLVSSKRAITHETIIGKIDAMQKRILSFN